MPATLGIDSVVFSQGAITFGGEQEHQVNLEKREVTRAGGASNFLEDTALVDMAFRVLIIHDDVATRKNMIAQINKEGTLTVTIKQINSATTHVYTYSNARYLGPRGSDFHGQVGNYVEEFLVRSADGLASPLAVA